MNVIHVDFSQEYRAKVFTSIKYYGVKHTEERMLADGAHPSFVKTIIRSIMGREGW